jgi:hypothetical protein
MRVVQWAILQLAFLACRVWQSRAMPPDMPEQLRDRYTLGGSIPVESFLVDDTGDGKGTHYKFPRSFPRQSRELSRTKGHTQPAAEGASRSSVVYWRLKEVTASVGLCLTTEKQASTILCTRKGGRKQSMTSFAATSSSSKTVSLTPDRVELLGGARGVNLVLLERVCQVNVEVLPLESTVAADGSTNAPTHAVVLTSVGSQDFGDKNFARKVHRYVKSSSRGGFIEWFPRLAFESSAQQSVRQKVRNAIDVAKSKFPAVECVLQCLVMQWTDPAKKAS